MTEPEPTLEAQKQKMPSRLLSIDMLRGMAALAVVFHHAINTGATPRASWYPPLSAFADYGRMGVPLFFVLSGFCIHYRWASARRKSEQVHIDFFAFWKRRLHRLYPPYLVALVGSMCLVLVAYFLHKQTPYVTIYPEPRLRYIGLDFLAHVTMLHGVIPLFDRAGGNAPFWTLAREEYFYLLYFLLLAVRKKVGPLGSVAGVTVLSMVFPLAFRPFLAEDSAWWEVINSSAITLWSQWCLGFLAVEAYFGLVTLPAWTRSLWLTPIWVAVAIGVNTFAPIVLGPLAWGMVFFTLLNGLVHREHTGAFTPGRAGRWFAGVGVFSYSIYLVHHPVRGIVKQVLEHVIEHASLPLFLACAATVLVAGYWAGKVFFLLVERRFLNPRSS